MTASSNVVPDRPIATSAAAAAPHHTSPFVWSIRRELWQYRAIVIGPLVPAGILGLTYMLGAIAHPSRFASTLAMNAANGYDAIGHPYALALPMVALGALFAGLIYCLDALHGERRDRNLLFWKSLPISDATVVFSKAAVALVVLPLVVFVVTMGLNGAMLLIASMAMVATGGNPVTLWRELPLLTQPFVMLYGIATLALQHAPVYAWLLMISALARDRTVLWAALWAFLPPYAVVAAEELMSGHSRFRALLRDIVIGGFDRSFVMNLDSGGSMRFVDSFAQLHAVRLFGRPSTLIGLLVTAAFLAIAIRVRRDREPV